MYVLDTNVISDASREGYAPRVLQWIEQHDAGAQYISVISLGEISRGIEKLPLARRRRDLERWLDGLQQQFFGRILDVDAETAILWGAMRHRYASGGETPPFVDLMIGATALRHGFTVVSRNAKDFVRFNVPVINPWEDENGA